MSNVPVDPRAPQPPNWPNANLVVVALFGGAAIGAILALVVIAVVWPEASSTAGAAIAAVSAVAGAALGALTLLVRPIATGQRP